MITPFLYGPIKTGLDLIVFFESGEETTKLKDLKRNYLFSEEAKFQEQSKLGM